MDVKPKNLNIYQVFKLKMNGCHMPSKTGGWVGAGGFHTEICRTVMHKSAMTIITLAF